MSAERGVVYLVGAGPGDPELLTLRASDLIGSADVILHDRLIDPTVLSTARADSQRIYVGKEGHGDSIPQNMTSDLLVKKAQAGLSVVRLKGGDPFVFGRGGEEALALVKAEVPFEVVPGVTAGVGAPAYAGIPVTHRGVAAAVAFVTGHEDPDKPAGIGDVDWDALAKFPGTLVIYMGIGNLESLCARLASAGRRRDETLTVIESGTSPAQRTIVSTVGRFADGDTFPISSPALAVIGDVGGLSRQLAWRRQGCLSGLTIAVTRARPQAGTLAARLRKLGAYVVEASAITITPRDDTDLRELAPDIGGFAMVCFTSPNGVDLFFAGLGRLGLDSRTLAGSTVAAIGPGTASALGNHGIRPDVVPARSVAEGLVEALASLDLSGRRVLLARGSGGREELVRALERQGASVTDLHLYDTVHGKLEPRALDNALRADYLVFASGSAVDGFVAAAGPDAVAKPRGRVLSIGPVTSQALERHGLRVDVEAESHSIDGLIEALTKDVERAVERAT